MITEPDGRQDVGLWLGQRLIKLCTSVKHSFTLKAFPEYAAYMDTAVTTDNQRCQVEYTFLIFLILVSFFISCLMNSMNRFLVSRGPTQTVCCRMKAGSCPLTLRVIQQTETTCHCLLVAEKSWINFSLESRGSQIRARTKAMTETLWPACLYLLAC